MYLHMYVSTTFEPTITNNRYSCNKYSCKPIRPTNSSKHSCSWYKPNLESNKKFDQLTLRSILVLGINQILRATKGLKTTPDVRLQNFWTCFFKIANFLTTWVRARTIKQLSDCR